jgi:mannitol-1-phosphate 5-dehydrogenase
MVPIMTRKDVEEDSLQVFAEPYNTLILDEKAFKNPIPDIPGLVPKKNMKAWVDRKSFIHNLGHAAGAYYSYIRDPRLVYFYQAMEDPDCREFTRMAMLQSAEALIREYPGEFTIIDLTRHIDDLLNRFCNKALGDTVFRVGMDLYRKLGPEDRLVGAIRMASKHGLPFDKIASALACGFHFRGTDEAGRMFPTDESFAGELNVSGPATIIKSRCGIDPSSEKNIFAAIMNALDILKNLLTANRP